MRIQHNIMAMNAYRNYNNNTSALSKNLEKLSSGYKINRAGDDAAGLAISEKMRAQITGLNAAQKNVKDGVSLVKTAEGAMQEIQDMLNRMDYLATQSANGTYDNDVDRMNLQKEVNALRSEIDRIADSANFNGIKLLDGKLGAKAGAAADVSVSVANDNATAGKSAKTPQDITLNFTPSTSGHTGIHTGTEGKTQIDPEFSIDLKDLKIATTASKAQVTVELMSGESITVTVSANGGQITGSDVATQLTGKAVTVDGVKFAVKTVANGKVTFATTATGKSDGHATNINSAIRGAEVKVTATVTSGGGTAAVGDNWTHGLLDVKEAVDTQAGKMAGISLTLNADLVKDGNTLKIGDKTFVFKVGDSKATVPTGATAVTVSGTTAADLASAAAQIAQSTNKVTDTREGNNSTEFMISSTAGGIIHLDQIDNKGNNTKVYNSADMLKGMFSAKTPSAEGTTGSIELTATPAAADVAVGDRVSYGGKSYIIADTSDTNNNKISIADLNSKLAADAADALDAAAKAKFGEDNYTITKNNTTGVVTVTAKNGSDGDTVSALQTKANEITLSALKVNKLGANDVDAGGLTLQIGDTSDNFNKLSVKIGDMHVNAMKAWKRETNQTTKEEEVVKDADGNITYDDSEGALSIGTIDISTQEDAQKAISVIKDAINYVSSVRGDLGAIQNRLEHTGNNLSVMAENIQDAESTIRDTDVADEMMSYVKNNILVQSAQAMLAQANQVPQGVLQLLG